MSIFQRAVREKAYIKINLHGPENSGKAMSALLLAQGIAGENGRVAVLDTENRSASLYDKLYAFDTAVLAAPFTPERYIEIIRAAAREGYDVLVIDSCSHEWAGTGGLLADKEALDRRSNNKFNNWQTITQRHEAFKDAILQSQLHIICTTRTKVEYAVDEQGGKPRKIGMAPIQREGWNYEFRIVFEIGSDHVAVTGKDNTQLFPEVVGKLTVEHGAQIRAWLEGGAEPAPRPAEPQAVPVDGWQNPGTSIPLAGHDRAPSLSAPRPAGNGYGKHDGARSDVPQTCTEEGCTVVLTPGQVSMSMAKYGRALCPRHQKDAVPRQAEAGAASRDQALAPQPAAQSARAPAAAARGRDGDMDLSDLDDPFAE